MPMPDRRGRRRRTRRLLLVPDIRSAVMLRIELVLVELNQSQSGMYMDGYVADVVFTLVLV